MTQIDPYWQGYDQGYSDAGKGQAMHPDALIAKPGQWRKGYRTGRMDYNAYRDPGTGPKGQRGGYRASRDPYQGEAD